MYGRRNPVLRHFGADELATFGTLHAIEERRRQGEFLGPAETAIERPTPVFDDYFEFDRPVPSGLSPNARDLLVEDASSPTPSRRPGAAAYSYSSPSPGAYSPAADPSSPAPSPPLGSYDSSPSVGYHAGGAESGGSASGSISGSPPPHAYPPSPDGGGDQRHLYGGYAYDRRQSGGGGSDGSPGPDPRSSPARSSMSRGTTSPRRPYSAGPSIQQPPFRSGVPASGPAREPGASGPAAGGRGRTTSSSPEASRSVSPSPHPSSDPATSEHRPSASDITSPGGAGATTRTPRRGLGLGAKISGRPLAVTPPPGGGGGGGGRRSGGVSPRGPASSRPQRGGGGSTWAAAGRISASGGARGRAPAWAPASGVANMRLEDEDEATRVAMMLNDPGARRDAMPPLRSHRGRQTTAADHQQQQQHGEGGQALSPRLSPGPPQPGGEGFSPSPGYSTRTNRASDQSEQFYGQYRLRKHREPQGVPDFRFSQPRSHGAHAPVSQRYFSFDEAHPALAEQHYIRSPAQERALQAERRKLQEQRMRAARAEARSRLTSPRPGPSAEQLVADVDRLARVRDAGRVRLRELEREGEALRNQTRQVQRRALDVIARSELMSATASRSASPGPSPRPVRSRSRSPSASPHYTPNPTPASYDRSFYSYRGSTSHRDRGTFGPPPLPPGGGYRSRSPSLSPGRQRPASASPGSVYQPGSPGGVGGSGSYYDSPPAHRQQPQSYVGGGGGGGGYYSGGGGGGAAQRPLSAPPTSQGGLATHGSDEAREVLEMINSVERLPQHEQTPVDDNGGGGADGDYLHRARSVATSRQLDTGLLDPDEQRIAMGAYDRSRYEEYQRQVDLEMQRRAVEGGYDSDVDRDEAAGLLVQDSEKIAAEEEERRRAEEAEREHRDAWMDEYRQRLGPEDGYLPQRTHSARELTFGGDVGGGGGGSASSPPAQRRPPVLSESERGMLREPFVPLVSPELTLSPGGGYASEGPDGDHPHRRTRRRLFFKSTVPEPFQFEERERARPKPIAKVKLEQDLALKRAEEEAARRRTFRAKPVPPAVVEPRYERMMLEAEAKRQLTHHQRLEELASMMEQPFSFYYRDRQQAEEREALARAAKDPNRFQVAFRARDVPQSTKEERFRALMIEMEAKREATRRRVEDARQAARERAAQEAAQRREAADRAYRERLRAVDPALHPYPPKPLGQVPDFNSLHRQFEVHMARARANIRKRVTVPQEFALNGSTPDQQTERARKAQERRQRIILDMQLDSELLPETRWPHKSPRGKVRRTPPPPYLVEWMAQAPANRASSARRTTTAVAAAGGAYQTRAEREEVERKASEKLRAEALKRADRLLRAAQERRQKEAAAGVGGGGGGDDFGLASDVGATAAGGADPPSDAAAGGRGAAVRRRAAVAGRQDNPEVYVEARHAQVEKHVRVVVEETLLDQGIEAYRYVEGIGADKRNKAGGGVRRGGAA